MENLKKATEATEAMEATENTYQIEALKSLVFLDPLVNKKTAKLFTHSERKWIDSSNSGRIGEYEGNEVIFE